MAAKKKVPGPLARRIEALEAEVKSLRATLDALAIGLRGLVLPFPWYPPKDATPPYTVVSYGCQVVGPGTLEPGTHWYSTVTTVSGVPSEAPCPTKNPGK